MMQGTSIIIHSDKSRRHTVKQHKAPIPLEELQAAVGGFIELIPGFNTFLHDDKLQRVAAYFNEEGRITALPMNDRATIAWHFQSRARDVIFGDIIVFGDDEFMADH